MVKKCILSVALVFAIVFTAVPAYAASSVSDRLVEISNSIPKGPNPNYPSDGCVKFVNDISWRLFGVLIPGGPNNYKLTGSSPYWTTIGTETGSNSQVKALLQKAQPGDVIQYCSKITNPQHTAMVYAVSEWGISIYDHNHGIGVQIRDSAWDKVLSWNAGNGLGDFEGGSQYGLSLYRCVKNPTNSSGGTYTPPTNNQPSQPTISTPVTNKVKFSNIKASNISETNAKLSASVSYSGTRPSEVGIYLGNSTGSMRKVGSDKINHSKNPFDMWYDLNKCGVTLSAGTQYYYKMYAIVNGKEFTSGTKNFFAPITIMTAPEEKPPKITAPTSTVDFSNIKAKNFI